MTITYKGFSTQAWLSNNRLGTSNIETVKRDLLNHIYTSPGERVGMPNWGTRIPTMVFEPNDIQTRQIIYDDLKMVIDFDPRVQLIGELQVLTLPDNNAIVCFCDLKYLEFNVVDTLNISVVTAG
jgi:phage baseplate assembly protein W